MSRALKTFPAFVTASSWTTVWDALTEAARKAHATVRIADGTLVPALTNGEVVTLIMGWLGAVRKAQWPMWYQYAAVAYEHDADAMYPADLTAELWISLHGLATALNEAHELNPRIDLDGAYDDPVFRAEVRVAVEEDGTLKPKPTPAKPARDTKPDKRTAPKAQDPFQLLVMLAGGWWLFTQLDKPTRRYRRRS